MTRTKSQKARAKQQRKAAKPSNKPRKVQRRRRTAAVGIRRGMFTKCAADYLKVVENPFSGLTACIPTLFAPPTAKMSLFLKQSFTTSSTTGFGGVTACPGWFFMNDANSTLGTGRAAVLWTASTSTTSGIPTYSDANVQVGTGNGPYSSADMGINVKSRVVGFGIRVRNITPLLNRGGRVILTEIPGHSDAQGIGYAVMAAFNACGSGDVNGSWSSVVWHPIDEDEMDFDIQTGLTNATNNVNNGLTANHSLCVMAVAPAGTPQTYEFEVYGVYEALGDIIRDASASHSDVSGMTGIMNATGSVAARRPVIGDRGPKVQSMLETAMSQLGSVAGNYALKVGTQALNNYINRPLRAPRIENVRVEEVD